MSTLTIQKTDFTISAIPEKKSDLFSFILLIFDKHIIIKMLIMIWVGFI